MGFWCPLAAAVPNLVYQGPQNLACLFSRHFMWLPNPCSWYSDGRYYSQFNVSQPRSLPDLAWLEPRLLLPIHLILNTHISFFTCRVLPSHLPACHGKWNLHSGKWISKPTGPNWQVDFFSGKWISKPTSPKNVQKIRKKM